MRTVWAATIIGDVHFSWRILGRGIWWMRETLFGFRRVKHQIGANCLCDSLPPDPSHTTLTTHALINGLTSRPTPSSTISPTTLTAAPSPHHPAEPSNQTA